jgi:hypothetical protein
MIVISIGRSHVEYLSFALVVVTSLEAVSYWGGARMPSWSYDVWLRDDLWLVLSWFIINLRRAYWGCILTSMATCWHIRVHAWLDRIKALPEIQMMSLELMIDIEVKLCTLNHIAIARIYVKGTFFLESTPISTWNNSQIKLRVATIRWRGFQIQLILVVFIDDQGRKLLYISLVLETWLIYLASITFFAFIIWCYVRLQLTRLRVAPQEFLIIYEFI